MIAYFFRFISDGEPTGHVGFALAENKEEMLWQIDEHGDPYHCQIKTTANFSWCAKSECFGDVVDMSNHETSSNTPMPKDNGWRDPPWVARRKEEERGVVRKPDSFGFNREALF